MTCAACSSSVERALAALPGVASASVALLQNRAEVVYDPAKIKEHPALLHGGPHPGRAGWPDRPSLPAPPQVEDLVEAVEDAGFEAEALLQ
eukprot:SM013728S00145  [mRNA]  locus=s13728:28:343:+ [translate_table: standard]